MGATGSRLNCIDFHWPLSDGGSTQDKIQALEQRCANMEAQYHTMEMKYTEMETKHEQKWEEHLSSMDTLAFRFDRLLSKFDSLELEHCAIMESDMVVLPSK
jgi:hypothetical protein